MVSKLLGRSKLWPAPLVSDAEFAVAAALDQRNLEPVVHRDAPSGHSLQVGRGSVTAACQATSLGGDLPGIRERPGLRFPAGT